MRKPIIIVLALCFMQFCITKCYAQPLKTDSLAENYAINYFNKAIGEQSQFFNGAEYNEYATGIKTNAFFSDVKDFKPGTVTFNGFTYYNVPIKLDVFKNVLVAQLYNPALEYVLENDKVSVFELLGHHFKYISADTVNNAPGSGFYDQLYSGKVEALAKYSKTMQSSTSVDAVDTYFTPTKKEYFIKKGTSLYSFDSQGSLLSILKDKKKELQQYIKANNIKYKKQPEQALVMITSYYDHLHF